MNNFAEYQFEWTPDYILWRINGVQVRYIDSSSLAVQFMNRSQHVMMNFWTATFYPWNLGFTGSNMPW